MKRIFAAILIALGLLGAAAGTATAAHAATGTTHTYYRTAGTTHTYYRT